MRCLHPCRPGRPGDHNGVGQAEVGRPTRTPRRLPVRFLCARASGEARGRVPHRGGLAAGVQRHQGPRSALAAGERAVLVIVRRRDTAQPSLGDRGEAELGGEGTQVAGRGVGDLHARMGARVARVRVGHRQNRRRVGAPPRRHSATRWCRRRRASRGPRASAGPGAPDRGTTRCHSALASASNHSSSAGLFGTLNHVERHQLGALGRPHRPSVA